MNLKVNKLVIFCSAISVFACKHSTVISNTHDLSKIKLEKRWVKLIDSIKMYNDSLAFDYFNLDKIDRDTILAFQYPVLNLSILDSSGTFKKEISRRGLLPENFHSQFITPQWDNYGNLYVLEQDNKTSVSVFDKNLKFKKRYELFKSVPNTFTFPSSTSFYLENKNDTLNTYISNGDTRYGIFSEDYYQNVASILNVELSGIKISKVRYEAPFIDYLTMQNAIKKFSCACNNLLSSATDRKK